MAKMLSPGAFAPRRPLGFARYIVMATIILLAFYTFSRSREVDSLLASGDPLSPERPNPVLNSPVGNINPEEPPSKGAGSPPAAPIVVDMGKTNNGAQENLDQQPQVNHDNDAPSGGSSSSNDGPEGAHPIDKLIYDAQHNYAELLSKESQTVEEAAQAYRKRRNRHPPPGFDKWFQFAQENDAVIVEDFFDQVYHDLEPFWGLPPAVMRKESWDYEMTIRVRDGKANTTSKWFWTVIWHDMVESIEHLLPDMDMALNAMDEPRLVVPWEDINGYMKEAAKTVGIKKPQEVVTEFQRLPKPGTGDREIKTRPKDWQDISASMPGIPREYSS